MPQRYRNYKLFNSETGGVATKKSRFDFLYMHDVNTINGLDS